jgi:hypothetical protein
MGLRAICAALVLSSLPIAGCGTVTNLVSCSPEAGGKTPFGGVRQDVAGISKATNGEPGFRLHPESDLDHPQVVPMLFYAADLPFTLVGDVVTWPYTAAYSFINQPVPVPAVGQAPPLGRVDVAPRELLPEPKTNP